MRFQSSWLQERADEQPPPRLLQVQVVPPFPPTRFRQSLLIRLLLQLLLRPMPRLQPTLRMLPAKRCHLAPSEGLVQGSFHLVRCRPKNCCFPNFSKAVGLTHGKRSGLAQDWCTAPPRRADGEIPGISQEQDGEAMEHLCGVCCP